MIICKCNAAPFIQFTRIDLHLDSMNSTENLKLNSFVVAVAEMAQTAHTEQLSLNKFLFCLSCQLNNQHNNRVSVSLI